MVKQYKHSLMPALKPVERHQPQMINPGDCRQYQQPSTGQDWDTEPILTLNELVLSRNHSTLPPYVAAQEDTLEGLQQYINKVYHLWWNGWNCTTSPV